MIPLFITRNFKQKFWHWVDGLLVFSMFRAVSAAVSFIYLNVLIGFFDNSVNGDYSLGHWLALIPTLILLNGGFLWSMFQVPRLTGMIFGGIAGHAQSFVDTVTSTIVRIGTA
jgi:type IV secretion system protein VirB6